MPSEEATPESDEEVAGPASTSGSRSAGRVAWWLLFLLQLAMFAACTRGAWLRSDLEWVAWVAAGGTLPMLMMRRIVPPSLLAAEPRWLFTFSLALLLAGGVIFTGLRGELGETLYVTLGAFSLGMGLRLSALGMQGRPGRRERTAILSPALEGPYIEALVKRPSVWLAMLVVILVGAGVWFSASMWPRITAAAPGIDRSGAEAVVALLAFWVGIVGGAMPMLSIWEKRNVSLESWVPALVLVGAALLVGLAPWWPGAFAMLPPCAVGYAWARMLRRAAEVLREEIPRSLEVRVASWLLTGSGMGALVAGLLAFSLSRSVVPEGLFSAWTRGPMTGVLLLLGAAGAAAILENSRRLIVQKWQPDTVAEGSAEESMSAAASDEREVARDSDPSEITRWIDFPGFELKQWLPAEEEEDGQVVEIAYDVPEENRQSFFDAMAQMERIRLEEGAVWWTLTGDVALPTVYHEFFLVASWTEHQAALAKEDGSARALKLQAFAANDWESLPAEIHYPVCDAKRPQESLAGDL